MAEDVNYDPQTGIHYHDTPKKGSHSSKGKKPSHAVPSSHSAKKSTSETVASNAGPSGGSSSPAPHDKP